MGAVERRQEDERWIISGDPNPTFPIPGRAARRRDLRLCWPEDAISAPAGAVPELTISLRNVGSEAFISGDAPRVVAWITGAAAEPLPAAMHYVYAGDGGELRIEAGGSVPCSLALLTEGVQNHPAGEYGLLAILVDLNLRSNTGALHLT